MGKYTYKIERDNEPFNPREDENLGTMVSYFDNTYFGDKHNLAKWEINKIENSDDYFSLPIYMYRHSGETISSSPFNCQWDSWKHGIIFVSREDVRKYFGIKKIGKTTEKVVMQRLQGEIDLYDAYLRGECYCYYIYDETGTAIESCHGYLADEEYCKKDAEGMVEWLEEQDRKKHQSQVKAYIKNRVPLERRV